MCCLEHFNFGLTSPFKELFVLNKDFSTIWLASLKWPLVCHLHPKGLLHTFSAMQVNVQWAVKSQTQSTYQTLLVDLFCISEVVGAMVMSQLVTQLSRLVTVHHPHLDQAILSATIQQSSISTTKLSNQTSWQFSIGITQLSNQTWDSSASESHSWVTTIIQQATLDKDTLWVQHQHPHYHPPVPLFAPPHRPRPPLTRIPFEFSISILTTTHHSPSSHPYTLTRPPCQFSTKQPLWHSMWWSLALYHHKLTSIAASFRQVWSSRQSVKGNDTDVLIMYITIC